MEKLRILFLITDLGKGGAERLLIDICTQLSEIKNVSFKIATVFPLNKNVKMTKDFDIISLDYTPIKFLQKVHLPKYKALLESFNPQIIHTNRYLAEFLSSTYVSNNISYFCHCHDNMIQLENISFKSLFSKSSLLNYYEKRILINKKYNKVPVHFLAISEDTKKYFKQVLPNKQKKNVYYLKNAIQYSRFDNKPTCFDNAPLQLVNVGSFQDKKNQQFLVEVARILKKKDICFQLRFLGDGALRKMVESKVYNYQLEDVVFFEGNVDNVEDYLKQANIYIHSAYYEPFGLVILEAMAAGLPVITLDGKGNRDIIVQGKNGFMLFEQDAEQFAQKIIELWNDDKSAIKKMSAYANQFAKQYDIKEYVQNLLQLYKKAITN